MIEKKDQPDFKKLVAQFVARRGPANKLAQQLAELANAQEFITGEGDTAVTVTSAAAVMNPTNQKVFHRTHTELLKLNSSDDIVMAWILDRLEGKPVDSPKLTK